jgi:hypothetical protein
MPNGQGVVVDHSYLSERPSWSQPRSRACEWAACAQTQNRIELGLKEVPLLPPTSPIPHKPPTLIGYSPTATMADKSEQEVGWSTFGIHLSALPRRSFLHHWDDRAIRCCDLPNGVSYVLIQCR